MFPNGAEQAALLGNFRAVDHLHRQAAFIRLKRAIYENFDQFRVCWIRLGTLVRREKKSYNNTKMFLHEAQCFLNILTSCIFHGVHIFSSSWLFIISQVHFRHCQMSVTSQQVVILQLLRRHLHPNATITTSNNNNNDNNNKVQGM